MRVIRRLALPPMGLVAILALSLGVLARTDAIHPATWRRASRTVVADRQVRRRPHPDQQQALVLRDGGTETHSIAPLRLHVISAPPESMMDVWDRYRGDPLVESAEPNVRRAVTGVPSDPAYPMQWALPRSAGTPSSAGSPDPAPRRSPSSTPASSTARRRRRRPGPAGFSAFGAATRRPTRTATAPGSRASPPRPPTTAMASPASHSRAPLSCRSRCSDADGLGQDSDIIEGVVWAADHGADVILMCFSNPGSARRSRTRSTTRGPRARSSSRRPVTTAFERRPTPPATRRSSASPRPTRPTRSGPAADYGGDTFLAAPGVGHLAPTRTERHHDLGHRHVGLGGDRRRRGRAAAARTARRLERRHRRPPRAQRRPAGPSSRPATAG